MISASQLEKPLPHIGMLHAENLKLVSKLDNTALVGAAVDGRSLVAIRLCVARARFAIIRPFSRQKLSLVEFKYF
jgi:hypothetical protein